MKAQDFALKRKLGVRMADGGLVEDQYAQPVGLANISLRDTPAAPVAPPPSTELPPSEPSRLQRLEAVARKIIRSDMPVRTGASSNTIGVRGAQGGETQSLVKQAKGRLGLRRGGEVDGPGGPEEDKVHAMLSNGEYVLPTKTTKAIGVDVLDQIVMETNDGKKPAGARAGLRAPHLMFGGVVDSALEEAARRARGMYDGFRSAGAAPESAVPTAEAAAPAPRAIASPAPLPESVQLEDTRNPVSRVKTTSYNPAGGAVEVSPSGLATTEAQRVQMIQNEADRLPKFKPEPGAVGKGLRWVGRATAPFATAGMAGEALTHAAFDNSDDAAANVEARTGLRQSTIERAMSNPIFKLAMPMGDNKFRADVVTGVGNSALSAVGMGPDRSGGGAQPPVVTADQATTAPGAAPGRVITAGEYASAADINNPNNVLRGFSDAPIRQAPVQPGRDATLQQDSEDLRAAIDKSTSRNPARGAGTNMMNGRYASNVASILQDRARAKLLSKKYESDNTAATSRQNNTDTNARELYTADQRLKFDQRKLSEDISAKSVDRVKEAIDRIAEVSEPDGKGGFSTRKNPEMRNKFQAYLHNSVSGFDTLSPEKQAAAVEHGRHGFAVNEIANTPDGYNILGKVLSVPNFLPTLGSDTAAPIGIKAIGKPDFSDVMTQKNARVSGLLGVPHIIFDNGKVFPLDQVLATPELKAGLETRIRAGLKSNDPAIRKKAEAVAKQYQKHLPQSTIAGAN